MKKLYKANGNKRQTTNTPYCYEIWGNNSMIYIEDIVKKVIGKLSRSDIYEVGTSCLEIIAKGFNDDIVGEMVSDYALLLWQMQTWLYPDCPVITPDTTKVAVTDGDALMIDGYIFQDWIDVQPVERLKDRTVIKYDRTNALLQAFKVVRHRLYVSKGVRVETPLDIMIDSTENGEDKIIQANARAELFRVSAEQADFRLNVEDYQTVDKVLAELEKRYPKQGSDAKKIIDCMINGIQDHQHIANHLNNINRDRVDYIVRTFRTVYADLTANNRRAVTWVKVPTYTTEWLPVDDYDTSTGKRTGSHLECTNTPGWTWHKVQKQVTKWTDGTDGKRKQRTVYIDPETGKQVEPLERTKSKTYIVDKGCVAKSKPVYCTKYSPSDTVYRGLSFDKPVKVTASDVVERKTTTLVSCSLTSAEVVQMLGDVKTPADVDLFKLCKDWIQSKPSTAKERHAVRKAWGRVKACERQRFLAVLAPVE